MVGRIAAGTPVIASQLDLASSDPTSQAATVRACRSSGKWNQAAGSCPPDRCPR